MFTIIPRNYITNVSTATHKKLNLWKKKQLIQNRGFQLYIFLFNISYQPDIIYLPVRTLPVFLSKTTTLVSGFAFVVSVTGDFVDFIFDPDGTGLSLVKVSWACARIHASEQ